MRTPGLEWVEAGTGVRGSDSPKTWTIGVPCPNEGARA